MRAKLQSDQTAKSRTALRLSEKRYRGENADFSDVLDFRFPERNSGVRNGALVQRVCGSRLEGAPNARIFCLRGREGFYFVDRAIDSAAEQLTWSRRCLTQFCDLGATNLQAQDCNAPPQSTADASATEADRPLPKTLWQQHCEMARAAPQRAWCAPRMRRRPSESASASASTATKRAAKRRWWGATVGGNGKGGSVLRKLRWATLGHHFDWTSRTYPGPPHARGSASSCSTSTTSCAMPASLTQLAQRLAASVGARVRADTAICNFYALNSTMAAHQDDCEQTFDHPVLSVSFGCTAVFLLGGMDREEEPVPMWIRSGDAIVLGGSTRLAFHAMARVCGGTCPEDLLPVAKLPCAEAAAQSRPAKRKVVALTTTGAEGRGHDKGHESDEEADTLVRDYLQYHRININIRQIWPDVKSDR